MPARAPSAAPLSPPQLPASDPALQQRLADLESSLWQEQQQLRLEQMRLQHIASQFHARNNDLLGGGAGPSSMFTLPPPLPSQQQLQQQPRHQGQVVPAGLSGYPSEAVLHASRAWMSPSRASSVASNQDGSQLAPGYSGAERSQHSQPSMTPRTSSVPPPTYRGLAGSAQPQAHYTSAPHQPVFPIGFAPTPLPSVMGGMDGSGSEDEGTIPAGRGGWRVAADSAPQASGPSFLAHPDFPRPFSETGEASGGEGGGDRRRVMLGPVRRSGPVHQSQAQTSPRRVYLPMDDGTGTATTTSGDWL